MTVRLAVFERGAGPPVVLLHGPMANATHWMGIIPGLVETHRVIVPDLPGHGLDCIGPVVCKLSTIAINVLAEIKLASDQPTVLKKGFSATRTGYFQINRHSFCPFARAVSPLCLTAGSHDETRPDLVPCHPVFFRPSPEHSWRWRSPTC